MTAELKWTLVSQLRSCGIKNEGVNGCRLCRETPVNGIRIIAITIRILIEEIVREVAQEVVLTIIIESIDIIDIVLFVIICFYGMFVRIA